jgi:hypothetical protein
MVALQFEARKVALKQDRTGYVLTLCLHPDQIPEELLRDFVGTRYGVAMVKINDDETPAEYRNRVQQAAILCKKQTFQEFLGVDTEDAAAEELCQRLSIQSRAELNGNARAKKEFDELVEEYRNADPFEV